ncbi:NmrA family NAD(P)-binding protein [Streptomyces shenzhenensis]|uniref:NmrA family NAD(P)-binding protein n=1 Tax=Streptomyces shenzhenensis TaxID=943815 RepID=UPI003D941D63
MKVAVVGATGNIGGRLSRQLLASGHSVRVLSRGGGSLDELVALGAEPVLGSFDDGSTNLGGFFAGVDAAFTMVRSDWSNVRHYHAVAERLADSLQASRPPLVANLSSIGADLDNAGHSSHFKQLETALNDVQGITVVHLRGGWFMENFLSHLGGVARFSTIASMVRTDRPLPLVATADIARAAAEEITGHSRAAEGIREVQGPEDLSFEDAADRISRAVGRPVRAVTIAPDAAQVKELYLSSGGIEENWEHRLVTDAAFNDGRVTFHGPRSEFDTSSMRFGHFVQYAWMPAYRQQADRTAGSGFPIWLAEHASRT